MTGEKIRRYINCLVFSVAVIIALVLPEGIFPFQVVIAVCVLTIVLFFLQFVYHLRKNRNLYGIVQALILLSLIIIFSGGLISQTVSYGEQIVAKENQRIEVSINEKSPPQQIFIGEIKGKTLPKAIVEMAWMPNREMTYHDVLMQTKSFHHKDVYIHLVGLNDDRVTLYVQYDKGRAISFVGAILLIFSLSLYAIPFARPKGGR